MVVIMLPGGEQPTGPEAGSDLVDGGSHLAQYTCSVGTCRRLETCWPNPAAASPHRTLSLTSIAALARSATAAEH